MNPDPVNSFYTALSTTSFTVLALWFTLLGLAAHRWRADPEQRRLTEHAALHLFLPGTIAFAALLAESNIYVWRVALSLVGLLGVIESVYYLRMSDGPPRRVIVLLRRVDPILYGLVLFAACMPAPIIGRFMAPLQFAGIFVGLVFIAGIVYLWFAFVDQFHGEGTGPAPAGQLPPPQPVAPFPQPGPMVPAGPQQPMAPFVPRRPAFPAGPQSPGAPATQAAPPFPTAPPARAESPAPPVQAAPPPTPDPAPVQTAPPTPDSPPAQNSPPTPPNSPPAQSSSPAPPNSPPAQNSPPAPSASPAQNSPPAQDPPPAQDARPTQTVPPSTPGSRSGPG